MTEKSVARYEPHESDAVFNANLSGFWSCCASCCVCQPLLAREVQMTDASAVCSTLCSTCGLSAFCKLCFR
jgi:hypothetical protein